jgi:hypothetical protein
MSEWHYSKNNQQQGPVSAEQLKQMAASGQLQPTDLVWKQGMSQWSEAHRMKGLFPANDVACPPPQLPNTITSNGTAASQKQGNGLIVAGYICGVLSLFLLPPALGLAGTVCGIVNLVRGRTGHGIAQIIISVTCGIFGVILGAMVMSQ